MTILDRIETLVRLHANPASNPGAHRLASKILALIMEDKERELSRLSEQQDSARTGCGI